MAELTIDEVKNRWNEVLDAVLEEDRIAWLAFFDGRLVSLHSDVLTISFVDVQKFGGDHDFSLARNPKHLALLQSSIKEIFGKDLQVLEV
jgi:citrate lyase alpha subunit